LKNTRSAIKAIIFDVDGTMIDNMMVHHRAWQAVLAENGLELELEEVRREIHGINKEILKRLFGDRFTQEDRQDISNAKEARYREIFKPDLKLIAGLDEYLVNCQMESLLLGVATAAPKENLDFVLDTLNIRKLFKATLHAGDVTKGKPDPEVYLKAAAIMRVEPTECLVFEDSPTGAESAIRAGMRVIVIKTTHSEEEFKHLSIDRFINDFREV